MNYSPMTKFPQSFMVYQTTGVVKSEVFNELPKFTPVHIERNVTSDLSSVVISTVKTPTQKMCDDKSLLDAAGIGLDKIEEEDGSYDL